MVGFPPFYTSIVMNMCHFNAISHYSKKGKKSIKNKLYAHFITLLSFSLQLQFIVNILLINRCLLLNARFALISLCIPQRKHGRGRVKSIFNNYPLLSSHYSSSVKLIPVPSIHWFNSYNPEASTSPFNKSGKIICLKGHRAIRARRRLRNLGRAIR